MTTAATWAAVLAASAVCFATKYAGHRVPEHWLAHPRVARIAALVTAALLAALVAVQTFVVVVVLAALVAAGLRALGVG